jgi:hypothetical protein
MIQWASRPLIANDSVGRQAFKLGDWIDDYELGPAKLHSGDRIGDENLSDLIGEQELELGRP